MSGPVVEWIEHFISQLSVVSEADDVEIQRNAIERMIKSCEEEIEQINELLDQLDEVQLVIAFIEMMAHASASCAMFKQALIVFDKQHKINPNILGDWQRGGTNARDN
tara:strand:+ start:645 stop:968 length:324 start_codon:yes stop_codon:yes gene_type:complete